MTTESEDELRAKYTADDRRKMASNGEAMPDGSYPIRDADDLHRAIHAVGRGNDSSGAIRRHIIKRAAALGLSSSIPDTWSSDGSLKRSGDDDGEFRYDAPREGIIRSLDFEAERSGDGLTFEGYAAVFGEETVVNSWEGEFRERMMPGSFKKTLSERMPVILFDHGKHPLIGQMPIGVPQEAREDSRGLYVRARLSDNWLIGPVRDAIRDGAVTGMSMRMNVVKDRWSRGMDRLPSRAIHEVAIKEMGPVVFPQYLTTAASVRSRETLAALEDPEIRSELARLFASGTDLRSAADDNTEPARHSVRTKAQRRALALALDL